MWSWLAIALSCLLFIFAVEKGDRNRSVLFSAMTHALLVAVLLSDGVGDSYQLWLLVGLGLFLLSDVANQFSHVLKLSFAGYLMAQFAYSWAMWGQVNSQFVLWLPALLLCIAIVTFFLLLPRLDSFLVPVTIMGISLVHLVCAAGEAWLVQEGLSATQGFLGALCLALSAMLLALDKYRFHSRRARYAISGSYYLAHGLIVASALG
ncbi:lysoplasmalogenase family protein [Vibrio hangzhouensis]|uniref:lysoplasmalogenase family protein n=1 Tax=Vibrio hangzhouensis TaxID=462991 RepID=UPI001C957F8A|nr:lysoplasmalogenase family protein [Vibrio hangzhouensis]MBY6199584.1 lysoplasmalogenase [Vibrio hangzhouensis]